MFLAIRASCSLAVRAMRACAQEGSGGLAPRAMAGRCLRPPWGSREVLGAAGPPVLYLAKLKIKIVLKIIVAGCRQHAAPPKFNVRVHGDHTTLTTQPSLPAAACNNPASRLMTATWRLADNAQDLAQPKQNLKTGCILVRLGTDWNINQPGPTNSKNSQPRRHGPACQGSKQKLAQPAMVEMK